MVIKKNIWLNYLFIKYIVCENDERERERKKSDLFVFHANVAQVIKFKSRTKKSKQTNKK